MYELLKDFISYLRGKQQEIEKEEKLRLPILYVYFPILVLHYWKPISVFLFSNHPIEKRILIIRHICGEIKWYEHLFNVFLLLLVATILSILFPLAMWVIDKLIVKPNNDRIEIKNKRKINNAETRLELDRIKTGKKENENYQQIIENQKITFENQIATLKEENDRLTKLSNENSINLSEFNNIKAELEKLKKERPFLIMANDRLNDINHALIEYDNISSDILNMLFTIGDKLLLFINSRNIDEVNKNLSITNNEFKNFIGKIYRFNIMHVYKFMRLVQLNPDSTITKNIQFPNKEEIIRELLQSRIIDERSSGLILTAKGNDLLMTLNESIVEFIKRVKDAWRE